MLAVDEQTMVLPVVGRHRGPVSGPGPGGDAPGEEPRPLRPGTAIYRCYRYRRGVDPIPRYADASVPARLPEDPREWRLEPWRQCEQAAEFDAEAAVSWFAARLREVIAGPGQDRAAAEEWVEARAGECAADLDMQAMAHHLMLELPRGGLVALAVVATWHAGALHPKLAESGWY
ncbi:hypothetical protein AB0A73_21805 [Glycomyces sp. NPDC047369]